MNNSARASVQRWYVAHLLERLGGRVDGGRVLEVGCGGGAGVEILLDRLGAAEVHAFDLDPRMIAQARRRLARRPPGQVRLSLGDVTAIGAADATYDGVFDFGAIHLVPNWAAALDEVRRVLKAGGVYCFELVTSPLLRLAYPVVTEGFRRMQAPTPQEFVGELERRGIVVARSLARPRLAALTQLAGDLIGVGRVVNVIDCPVDSKKKSPGTNPGLSNNSPATSYSPTRSTSKYHRGWRA